MKKTNLPDTSKEAYKKSHEMAHNHRNKIVDALKVLGKGSYEDLANYLKMDRHQIGRRLSELEREQIIYKPGEKKPTKSGRDAYVYYLTESNVVKTAKEISNQEFLRNYQDGKYDPPTAPRYTEQELF